MVLKFAFECRSFTILGLWRCRSRKHGPGGVSLSQQVCGDSDKFNGRLCFSLPKGFSLWPPTDLGTQTGRNKVAQISDMEVSCMSSERPWGMKLNPVGGRLVHHNKRWEKMKRKSASNTRLISNPNNSRNFLKWEWDGRNQDANKRNVYHKTAFGQAWTETFTLNPFYPLIINGVLLPGSTHL